jgi:pimeloyl-ACP methyl ester carboxylesterase
MMNLRWIKQFASLSFCAAIVTVSCAFAQNNDLPRHAVIGLQVAPPNLDKPEDTATNPPTVKAVAAGGAGEAAGIQAGDVLVELDSEPVTTSADFAHKIARHLAGDSVSIRLLRQGTPITKIVVLKPRPFESSSDAEVLYGSVSVDGARRRAIVTHPKTKERHPAVLLIGGLGCYSLDGELSRPTGYGPILSALAKNGYVTMRVEKTGEGDSEGPVCTDAKATAELEAQGYTAGLRQLKGYDFVDPTRVFIFAHSLGPLLGSLVITQEPVRGFVAAETIGRSWYEYGLDNVRRQTALLGEPLDQVNAEVRAHAVCASHFFLQHEPADQVSKEGEQCADMIRSYAGMSSLYMQEIGDLSLAKQWKTADMPVLVIYGTSDPATSADESRYLVELINSFHPGRASYVEITGMGHDFARYDSQLEFLTRRKEPNKPHPYDDEVVTILLKWLAEHA